MRRVGGLIQALYGDDIEAVGDKIFQIAVQGGKIAAYIKNSVDGAFFRQ